MYGMVERTRCTGCGLCAAVCGKKAIAMRRDREGFLYPEINPALCTKCGLCGRACADRQTDTPSGGTCWGARAEEEAVRELGSSGGIFPLMAQQVIREGGAVFGASLREDGTVRHIGVSRLEDIVQISRTKYVQSELSQVWEDLPPLLRQGRQVLFCGTPCQAAAVGTWLGAERRRVILADLVCYGVPSPGIWEDYVRWLERRWGGPFQSFSFRDKRAADNGHTAAVRTGGQEYAYPLYQDRFCRSYFKNVNIRPACFHCAYCTPRRSSDVTLGDFWGVEDIRPGFSDGRGVSAVICHTPAGEALWEKVRDRTRHFSCREEDVANDKQPRLREPTQPSPRRERYMGLYGKIPFSLWLYLFRR